MESHYSYRASSIHSTAFGQLLTVPPFDFATIVLYIFAYLSDKIKRSPFILAGLLMCAFGFAINISNVAHGVKYFGTFVVAGSYSAFPGVVAWYPPLRNRAFEDVLSNMPV
ncbi:hypothetical protein E4T56_gene5075 [Termitomyces sp. T112]|nr:hypothetical protein E4T56_gene5075 [Termitomyces sp. T112]